MRRRTKVLLTAAVAVPLVIGGTGTAYAAHFQSRALPGSTVSGMSVAGLNRAEVARAVRERAADVTVTVTNGDTTEKARLAEADLASASYDEDDRSLPSEDDTDPDPAEEGSEEQRVAATAVEDERRDPAEEAVDEIIGRGERGTGS